MVPHEICNDNRAGSICTYSSHHDILYTSFLTLRHITKFHLCFLQLFLFFIGFPCIGPQFPLHCQFLLAFIKDLHPTDRTWYDVRHYSTLMVILPMPCWGCRDGCSLWCLYPWNPFSIHIFYLVINIEKTSLAKILGNFSFVSIYYH